MTITVVHIALEFEQRGALTVATMRSGVVRAMEGYFTPEETPDIELVKVEALLDSFTDDEHLQFAVTTFHVEDLRASLIGAHAITAVGRYFKDSDVARLREYWLIAAMVDGEIEYFGAEPERRKVLDFKRDD